MEKSETIGILGGDKRMALLARLLQGDGFAVTTWGLERFDASNAGTLEEAAASERVILPAPLARGSVLHGTELPLAALFARLGGRGKIYAGGVKPSERVLAEAHGVSLTDYLAREELAVRNAVPTAEGAIELALHETAVTLHGAPCLVLGFGRIGKLLAHRLRGLGALVTVAARRLDDLAWIDAFGYATLRSDRLAGKLGGFRVVFNTVPHLLLTEALLRELPPECVLLELASVPGFDRAAAEGLGLRVVPALGLPGKTAPETAARAVHQTLLKIWEEEV